MIDAADLAGAYGIVSGVLRDISGTPVEIRNLDALYDAITEYGGRLRLVVRNAGKLPSGARRMLDDALAKSPGLEIDFGRLGGHAGAHAG